MTNYGDSSNYCAIISSAESGGSPSGDLFYVFCQKVRGNFQSKMKVKNYSGGYSFSNRDGKRSDKITLSDCWVIPYSTYTKTESFEKEIYWLKERTKMGASPCYLWVYHIGDTDYAQIGQNASVSSQYAYMKGYPTDFNWELVKGYYYIKSIEFKECLN